MQAEVTGCGEVCAGQDGEWKAEGRIQEASDGYRNRRRE